MGYICHHAIIVTTSAQVYVSSAHRAAEVLGCQPSEVMQSPINGYYTFLIPPDGSNEGWEQSDDGDLRREKFVDWLNSQRFKDGSTPYNWAEIQYGDDEGDNKVLRSDETLAHAQPSISIP